MANRQERRKLEKLYRKNGMGKMEAKAFVNYYHTRESFKVGQKCQLNYEMIIRHPQFKLQKEDFREWVLSHKDMILTVKEIRNDGFEVTFEEDYNEKPYWHHTETLIALPTATIKIEGQEDQIIPLDPKDTITINNINEIVQQKIEENK